MKVGRFVGSTQFRLRFSLWLEAHEIMHWDVVEVSPTAGYALLVRFKDGLEGTVSLRPNQLTGVLEPLRDEDFFKKVFIDDGAVAWPGEIDLAPDAMYAEISGKLKNAELLFERR